MLLEDEYKIVDLNWFKENINTLIRHCSLIVFHNIETYEVVDDIIISNDIIFNAAPTTNINFIDSSSITIKYYFFVKNI